MAEGHLERLFDRGNWGGRSRSNGYAKWPSSQVILGRGHVIGAIGGLGR